MKTCKKCNEEKDFYKFSKHKATKDGLQPWCRACTDKNSKAVRQMGRDHREAYIEARTGMRCEICNNKYHQEVLDFHHRDPSTKEFGLQGATWRQTKVKTYVLEEADKCSILCANCHRMEHIALKEGNSLLKGGER